MTDLLWPVFNRTVAANRCYLVLTDIDIIRSVAACQIDLLMPSLDRLHQSGKFINLKQICDISGRVLVDSIII